MEALFSRIQIDATERSLAEWKAGSRYRAENDSVDQSRPEEGLRQRQETPEYDMAVTHQHAQIIVGWQVLPNNLTIVDAELQPRRM